MPPSSIGYLNHDPTIDRRPAYTIGHRHRDLSILKLNMNFFISTKFHSISIAKDSQSPGPIYMVNPKVYNRGREASPTPHIVSRPKDYSLYVGPGPAHYSPERIKSSAPAFTIGVKHKHLELPVHPVGPNQVNKCYI